MTPYAVFAWWGPNSPSARMTRRRISVGRIERVYGTGAAAGCPVRAVVARMRRCDDMDEDDRQFYRWYGPWTPLTPPQVADLFAGVAARWWIVGGWAVDAFTGRSRDHDDIDIGFFKADLPAILDQLSPDLCVW